MSVWDTLIKLEEHQPQIARAKIQKVARVRLWDSPMSEYVEAYLNADDEPNEAWLYDTTGEFAPIGHDTRVWKWLESVIEEAVNGQA